VEEMKKPFLAGMTTTSTTDFDFADSSCPVMKFIWEFYHHNMSGAEIFS
jgi:hypothetical protein